jgi:hypothetical protein
MLIFLHFFCLRTRLVLRVVNFSFNRNIVDNSVYVAILCVTCKPNFEYQNVTKHNYL